MTVRGTVFIVDDDPAIRDLLTCHVEIDRFTAKAFASARDFLEDFDPEVSPACLVLDLKMPGMDGVQLLKWLTDREIRLPVIILTGHADVPTAVDVLTNGACDFVQKPCTGANFMRRVHRAIEHDAKHARERVLAARTVERLQTLTPRELDVVELLVLGNSTKQIAAQFGTSYHTVHNQRKTIIKKMGASSVVDIVRMVALLGSRPAQSACVEPDDSSFERLSRGSSPASV